MAHGQITHIEFPADDTDRAQKFYSGIFGWEFQSYEGLGRYYLFDTGSIESAGGAIGMRGESTGEKLRIYVTVDSIDAALAKVPGLGGKVVEPKTEIPTQGWYAVIDDTEGNQIGLYENLPSA